MTFKGARIFGSSGSDFKPWHGFQKWFQNAPWVSKKLEYAFVSLMAGTLNCGGSIFREKEVATYAIVGAIKVSSDSDVIGAFTLCFREGAELKV